MRPIVLSGFMATGKSTIGRLLADKLGVPFVDTDAVVSEAAGMPTGELFVKEGEARFREREAEVALALLADPRPRVIAFGGGTVTIPRVRHAALEAATLVTLTAPADVIVSRVASLDERPNLRTGAPAERARDLLALRREAYAECHAQIDTTTASPEVLADRIAALASKDLVAVPLGTRSYVVEIGNDAPRALTDAVEGLAPTGLVVVTDDNVHAARGAWLDAALAGLRFPPRVHVITLAHGESNKTLESVARIWDEALTFGVDRRTLVLAFGGGVVGDLGGFAASTLLRGVRCVQIPTTVLSMVDSSVGGKTGFDHATGKNLVGSFFQPTRVVLDLAHTTTLPARERAAGLAEVVKIALACDAPLLDAVEASADRLAAGDVEALRPIVRDAVRAKVRVVVADEHETGVRALLNLGHTVGHALESHGGYARHLHGEAVAIGTVLEIEACERLGLTPPGLAARAARLFDRLGLPSRVERSEVEASFRFVLSDKKRDAASIKQPALSAAGQARVEPVAIAALKQALLA